MAPSCPGMTGTLDLALLYCTVHAHWASAKQPELGHIAYNNV